MNAVKDPAPEDRERVDRYLSWRDEYDRDVAAARRRQWRLVGGVAAVGLVNVALVGWLMTAGREAGPPPAGQPTASAPSSPAVVEPPPSTPRPSSGPVAPRTA